VFIDNRTSEKLSQSVKGLSYTGSFPLVTATAFYVERRRLCVLSINIETRLRSSPVSHVSTEFYGNLAGPS
jgi:hypothetical protein